MPETADSSRRFSFGHFELDIRSGELRKQGVRIKLQDQPFQVLLMLLERAGEIVTREEIQRRLWPDTVVEYESNLNAAIKRLREALNDSADNPRFIETIPRRGYRFIVTTGVNADTASAPDPSVAVLPFRNRSPQPDQEYFSDGITEELTDALAKVENLRVVSRTSAFQYKGRTEDVRKIGSELNVGTLVEGSVRRAEGTLRMTVHLTRVKDGCHIWSQSYECSVQDVFDVQDEITAAIVGSLSGKLGWNISYAPGPRLILSKPTLTKDLVAYDSYLRGLYWWNHRDAAGIRNSIPYFQQAIARDPDYALPHAALAEAYISLASVEEDAGKRDAARAAARTELEKYVNLVRQNYELKRPVP